MMYLVAAIVLVGAVALINLALTYGVIRRLRQHTELLSKGPGGQARDDLMRPVGSAVDEFEVSADGGTLVSRGALHAYRMVAFLSPGCGPCAELKPRLLAAAAEEEGRILTVVLEDPDDEDYRAELATLTTVVSGRAAQQVIDAFSVTGFPAVCTVDEHGSISATGTWLVPERKPDRQPVAA